MRAAAAAAAARPACRSNNSPLATRLPPLISFRSHFTPQRSSSSQNRPHLCFFSATRAPLLRFSSPSLIRRCFSSDNNNNLDDKNKSNHAKKSLTDPPNEDDVIHIRMPSSDAADDDEGDTAADVAEASKADKTAALRADINLQGGEYFRLGMYDEAEVAFTKVLEMIEEELGGEHPDVATVLNNLGMVQANRGALDEAFASLQRALVVRETILGGNDESLVTPLNNLGLICKRRKDLEGSINYFTRALELLESLRLQDDMQFGTILNNAASVRYQQKRFDDARELFRRATEVRLFVVLFPPKDHAHFFPLQIMAADHPELGVALGNLLFLERQLKQYTEAARTGERLLQVMEANEEDAESRLRVLMQVADVHVALGDKSTARQRLEEAKQMQQSIGGDTLNIDKKINSL